jgi:hypothetical protein
MRWPRPRFTVGRLMVAIAILALVFGTISWVAEMRARSAAYRRRAFEVSMHTMRRGHEVHMPDGRWVDSFDNENDLLHDAWKWRMAAKYLRLSYYPWLTAEPDPPRPEPLAHPRSALELPTQDDSVKEWVLGSRAPAWTFLWTWRRPGSPPW